MLSSEPYAPFRNSSRDYYIRMTEDDIRALVLQHVYTEILETAPRRNGITEWTAECDGGVVTVGWDWTMLDDGAIEFANPALVRCNLMLLSSQGYDLGPEATGKVLQAAIRRAGWSAKIRQSTFGSAVAH